MPPGRAACPGERCRRPAGRVRRGHRRPPPPPPPPRLRPGRLPPLRPARCGQIFRPGRQRAAEPRAVGGPGQAGHRGRRDGHELNVHDARQSGPRVEQRLQRPQPGVVLPDVHVHPDGRGPAGQVAGHGGLSLPGQLRPGLPRSGPRAELRMRLYQRGQHQVASEVQRRGGQRLGEQAPGRRQRSRRPRSGCLPPVHRPAAGPGAAGCGAVAGPGRAPQRERRDDEHVSLLMVVSPGQPWQQQ